MNADPVVGYSNDGVAHSFVERPDVSRVESEKRVVGIIVVVANVC